MSETWRRTTWGEIASLEYGRALRDYTQEVGRVRVYGTNGPIGWCDEAISNEPGVVIGRKGAYRGVHYSRQPFFVIDTAYWLKPIVDISMRWAYYALVSVDINNMDSGSAIPSTSRADFYSLPVVIPPRWEQDLIGFLLGALDDKIELNRRMCETLEAMALALFIEHNRTGNWPETPLGSVCDIFDGPHATPKLADSGPIFLGISNLADGLLNLAETNHVSEDDFATWTRRVTPQPGDVVFSYETRLGQAALIPEGLRCCLGRRMGLLRPKPEKIDSLVLLRAYLAFEFQKTIRQRTIHGSTVDRIPLKDMGGFPIRLPKGTAVERLGAKLRPLRNMVEYNQRESRTLAELRDLLLPKLMSGEIRVKDAERMVGDVA